MQLSDTPSLGLAHFTLITTPPLELVRLAANVGYAAIGLRLHPAFPGAPTYEIPVGSETSREMQRRLHGEGVRVYDIEFVTIGQEFSPASLKGMLEAASALEAQRLSVCGDDPDWSRLVANFAALCDLAAEFGIGVDLECMAWRTISSLPLAVRVVEEAARPNGGVLIDALHLSRTEGSPEMLQSIASEMIRSVQLCDARAERPVGNDAIILEARSQRQPPGMGDLPLCDLIAALPEHAVLSVEVPIVGDTPTEEHARRIYDATQVLFERCRVAGDRRRAQRIM